MKRLRIFLWLKVKEIGIVVLGIGFLYAISYYPAWLIYRCEPLEPKWFSMFLLQLLVLCIYGVLICSGIGMFEWFKSNWQKAGEIEEAEK